MRAVLPVLVALAPMLLAPAAFGLVGVADGPVVVVGHGTMTFRHYSLGLNCPNFDTRIEVVGTGTATVTIQAVETVNTLCTFNAQYYSVNPSIVVGDWEHGWFGHAVGADPPLVWPQWPVYIGPATDPSNVYLWSYYVDVNGREYLFDGYFAIEQAV